MQLYFFNGNKAGAFAVDPSRCSKNADVQQCELHTYPTPNEKEIPICSIKPIITKRRN